MYTDVLKFGNFYFGEFLEITKIPPPLSPQLPKYIKIFVVLSVKKKPHGCFTAFYFSKTIIRRSVLRHTIVMPKYFLTTEII